MPKLSEYRIVITHARRRDGSPWVAAQVGELPGCIAEGPTEAAARKTLEAIFPDYLESLKADGVPVPEPRAFSVSIEAALFWNGRDSVRLGGPAWVPQPAVA